MRRLATGALRRLRVPAAATATGVGGLALYLRGAEDEMGSVSESELPAVYDPDEITRVWRQHPRCALSRLGKIVRSTAPFAAQICGDVIFSSSGVQQAARARELRELLTDLGPTFIKFGQMLSIRPDVLPPTFVYELQKLCDAVPSYPTAEAIKLVEAELGQPVEAIFEGLDQSTMPIAAASLGQVRSLPWLFGHDAAASRLLRPLSQVYRVRLRDGGEVALKVQRPDMIRAVSLDLFLLRHYMYAVEWFKVNVLTGLFGAADRSSFDVKLLDTFAVRIRAGFEGCRWKHTLQPPLTASHALPRLALPHACLATRLSLPHPSQAASYLELDYLNEAANGERFARELVPRLGGKVHVPRCERRFTTRKVLVTEWIEGIQLARSPPHVINELVDTGVACFLAQLLEARGRPPLSTSPTTLPPPAAPEPACCGIFTGGLLPFRPSPWQPLGRQGWPPRAHRLWSVRRDRRLRLAPAHERHRPPDAR